MTARLSLDPPLASADTWAGRQAPSQAIWREREAIWHSNMARRDQAAREYGEPETPHPQTVTPLAEHVVLDCLRALKVISPSPYALGLIDMISRGYLETPEQIVRMRRIAALMEIDVEEPAP